MLKILQFRPFLSALSSQFLLHLIGQFLPELSKFDRSQFGHFRPYLSEFRRYSAGNSPYVYPNCPIFNTVFYEQMFYRT